MQIENEFIEEMKRAVRVKTEYANEEIKNLVNACIAELSLTGVYISDITETLSKQVITLYCKAHYGYDEKTEPFLKAYQALRDAMALSGDYEKAKEETDGSNTDHGDNHEG